MAVTADLYGNLMKLTLNKEVDWNSDSIKLMLCSALTFDQDNDVYLADVTKTEVTGTGYTAGGKALTFGTATAISYNGTTNTVTIDADDTTWESSSINAEFGLLYDDTDATNKGLVGYVNFGQVFTSSNGTFLVEWASGGIATFVLS